MTETLTKNQHIIVVVSGEDWEIFLSFFLLRLHPIQSSLLHNKSESEPSVAIDTTLKRYGLPYFLRKIDTTKLINQLKCTNSIFYQSILLDDD